MKHRRPFLLLELCISMMLFGGIIWVLLASQRQLYFSKSTLQGEKETIMTRLKLQLRLSQILPNLHSIQKSNEKYLLTFDNGIDHDPAFRGVKEGMLYLDKNTLSFVIWSKDKARVEYLHPHIRSFTFSFFDSRSGKWSLTYPSRKPFMIKLELILHHGAKLELPFFL